MIIISSDSTADLNELLQNYVNLDYEDILSIANTSLAEIMPVFNELADDGNGAKFVLPFICTSLAVDGKLSKLEYKFICDLIGDMDYDTVLSNVQEYYSDSAVEFVDNVCDACPDDLKTSLLTFCLAFLAVDETISREEVAFVKRLLA